MKNILYALACILLVTMSCGTSNTVPTFDPNTIQTVIASTAAAAQTQTQIALPPTPTIIPISTATLITIPTNTLNTSSVTTEEKSYALSMSAYTSDYADAMKELGILLQLPSTDSTLMLDDDWKLKVAAQIYILQTAGDGMGNIPNPPLKFQQTDYWLKQISTENKLLISNLTTGIDNLDTDSMNRTTANINNINIYIQNATAELNTAISTLSLGESSLGGICSCNANNYNCENFTFQSEAQQCFNYCISQGMGDIHQLDDNNDNLACENLP